VLNLVRPTDEEWISRARVDLEDVLIDHAHCEKKAASTAVGLLFRYPERRELLEPLAALAREELAHFTEVLRHLDRLGIAYRRLRPSPYAGRLLEAVRDEEPGRLIDTLLCLALIEARSCERMKLLAGALDDPELRALYSGLLASEARHHQIYVDLACAVDAPDRVRARLLELSEHESRVIGTPAFMTRMHA
jgi:tRNA-(ms[2]io[6]A)-hydroxylase